MIKLPFSALAIDFLTAIPPLLLNFQKKKCQNVKRRLIHEVSRPQAAIPAREDKRMSSRFFARFYSCLRFSHNKSITFSQSREIIVAIFNIGSGCLLAPFLYLSDAHELRNACRDTAFVTQNEDFYAALPVRAFFGFSPLFFSHRFCVFCSRLLGKAFPTTSLLQNSIF